MLRSPSGWRGFPGSSVPAQGSSWSLLPSPARILRPPITSPPLSCPTLLHYCNHLLPVPCLVFSLQGPQGSPSCQIPKHDLPLPYSLYLSVAFHTVDHPPTSTWASVIPFSPGCPTPGSFFQSLSWTGSTTPSSAFLSSHTKHSFKGSSSKSVRPPICPSSKICIPSRCLSPGLSVCIFSCLLDISTWMSLSHFKSASLQGN